MLTSAKSNRGIDELFVEVGRSTSNLESIFSCKIAAWIILMHVVSIVLSYCRSDVEPRVPAAGHELSA